MPNIHGVFFTDFSDFGGGRFIMDKSLKRY